MAKGETGPNLFPRPVYEEGPFEQRQKMLKTQKDEFDRNLSSGKNLNALYQQNLDHLYFENEKALVTFLLCELCHVNHESQRIKILIINLSNCLPREI